MVKPFQSELRGKEMHVFEQTNFKSTIGKLSIIVYKD